MEHRQGQECTCTNDGYSPDCPHAFIQGGQVLHTINPEMRLRPRQYGQAANEENLARSGMDKGDLLKTIEEHLESLGISSGVKGLAGLSDGACGTGPEESQYSGGAQNNKDADPGHASSEYLRMGNSGSLDRFKPLILNGVSMTKATIGGYALDMASMAKQAAKVAPLPPVLLPLIFKDNDLNFMHHFFNGLEVLGGRAFICMIAETGRYSREDAGQIGPLVKALATSGYSEDDTDLVVFVKRVMSTTFEVVQAIGEMRHEDRFLVKSNFYGFQYIEAGMPCMEQDLKMWLHSAHMQYRSLWFNAFKSSGIPSFALDGVQDRYTERPGPNAESRVDVNPPRARERRSPPRGSRPSRRHTTDEGGQALILKEKSGKKRGMSIWN